MSTSAQHIRRTSAMSTSFIDPPDEPRLAGFTLTSPPRRAQNFIRLVSADLRFGASLASWPVAGFGRPRPTAASISCLKCIRKRPLAHPQMQKGCPPFSSHRATTNYGVAICVRPASNPQARFETPAHIFFRFLRTPRTSRDSSVWLRVNTAWPGDYH